MAAPLPRPTPGVLSAFGSGTYAVSRPQRVPVIVLARDVATRLAAASALGDYHVHEADSLAAAGAMVSELRPRAIVCSMAFDPLQLLCFARWLRANFGRTVAIVVLTPRGDAAQAIRALQLGARACIDLPIDPARLRTALAKHAGPVVAGSGPERAGGAA